MTPDVQIFAMLWSWLQHRNKDAAAPTTKTGSVVRFPPESTSASDDQKKRKAA